MLDRNTVDLLVAKIKSKLETEHAVSVIETLSDFNKQSREADEEADYIKVTQSELGQIATAITKDGRYLRRPEGRDILISVNPHYRSQQWFDKPVWFEIFKALLTAAFTLGVGLLTGLIQGPKEDQVNELIKQKLQPATSRIDSVANALSEQKLKTDSLASQLKVVVPPARSANRDSTFQ